MAFERRSILFLHPSAELYGADRTLLDLVLGLPAERFEVTVTLPHPGPLSEELLHHGISVRFGPLGVVAMSSLSLRGAFAMLWNLPRGFFFVRKLVRELKTDIVHTNTMVVLGGALAARATRAKHLWHIHEFPTQPRWLAPFAARFMQGLSDQVVCNSHATAHAFLRHHRTLTSKTTVVHNGVDPARFGIARTKEEVRARLAWPKLAPIALVIGRINTWKGQDLAVKALHQLRESHPDLRLAIVGGPPPGQEHLEEQLTALIRQLGLEQRVLRHPFDEQVARYYAACDFVVVPSKRPEPFGLVLLEAFLAQKPVLAAGHGGPLEIVTAGESGEFFESGNVDELSSKIANWVERPDDLAAMGVTAAKRARTIFSLRSYRQRFERLYRLLPIRSLGMHRSSGMQDWPAVVHIVLGKANPNRMNGINRFVHELACAQSLEASAKHRIEVWGLCHAPDAPTPVRPYRLRTFPRLITRTRVAQGLLAYLDALAKSGTVFHLHGAFLPEMARIGKELRSRNLPYVCTTHGAYTPAALGKGRMRKWIYRLINERGLFHGARAVQTLSASEESFVRRVFSKATVYNIPPGVESPGAPAKRSKARNGPLRLGFLGRLDLHTKGLDRLLQGVADFLESGGEVRLTLGGLGPDQEALRKLSATLGIEHALHWLGEIQGADKERFFEEIDLLVLMSRHEGLPGAPLEAAARGCPLLMTRETNLGDAVLKHEAGWVLEDTNRETVTEALTLAWSQPDEAWRRLGSNAQEMVREEFSWSRILQRMQRDLYGLDPAPTSKAQPSHRAA